MRARRDVNSFVDRGRTVVPESGRRGGDVQYGFAIDVQFHGDGQSFALAFVQRLAAAGSRIDLVGRELDAFLRTLARVTERELDHRAFGIRVVVLRHY